VGTDEQRANGVPVNAGAGQPAADDELANTSLNAETTAP
jgi:hypothetical protein